MAFQFNQIDQIADFDEAVQVLEDDYIGELIEQFIQSPEGQAYLQSSPEAGDFIGDWIGNFIMLGYTYCGRTLPKIRQGDAAEILGQLFPRQLMLQDPTDAETIIPELIAFWTFLQRQYKPRNSKKILEFLHQIESEFPDIMNDPNNFGMAKSFMMAGQTAGFDMTTQEGVTAFQTQYNQQIRETGAPPPGFPGLPVPQAGAINPLAQYPIPPGVPPEFVALLSQQMGLGPVPGLEHLPADPNQLVHAIAQRLIDSGVVQLTGQDDAGEEADFFGDLEHDLLASIPPESFVLQEEAIALLTQQTITDTTPGTIVKDFDTLLAELAKHPLPVSGKLNQFPAKVVTALNAQLSHPIHIDLQRPVQKSFPNLHGLYLLLRTTGLGEIGMQGKKAVMTLNPEVFASWNQFNPTEKYFTLLEAWVIRSTPELLGDTRSPFGEGTRVLKAWQQQFYKNQTYKDYSHQNNLNYWPGLHNVALLEMFGWIAIKSPKPDAGKGWRIKQVNPLPLGDAMVALLIRAYAQEGYSWPSQRDFTQPWGELQPYVTPYFPEWRANLASSDPVEHQVGTYIFKVSLGKIWRRIAISSEATLATLAGLILKSVDFDRDHLDMFSFRDRSGRLIEVHHSYNDWANGASTDEVEIGDLPLKVGSSMTYLFDFGDHWEFNVLLEEIQPGKPKRNANKVLESHGQAPEQYPNYDEYQADA